MMRGRLTTTFSHALVAVVAALLVCAGSARAAEVADYRARVTKAAELLEGLASSREAEEDSAPVARGHAAPSSSAQTFAQVRALVPETERVESGVRGGLEVDNGWLHVELSRAEQLKEDSFERAQVLSRASERLRTIAARLVEYEEATAAARDKEAEKGRLASILRQPEYAERGTRDDAISRLRERLTKWLRDLFPSFKPIQPGTDPWATTIAQLIIYALIAALIAYVGWRLWRRRGLHVSPVPRTEARIVLGERLAPELTAADLLAEAESLARAGQLRGAIRRAYVALLVELGERGVVRLARHKTNRDYLRAVGERASHLFPFVQPLTSDFERHWYGLEEATEEDWTKFQTGCRQALDS